MRSIPFKVSGAKGSIKVEHDKLKRYYAHFHYHNEIQITLIVKGFGKVIVGDGITNFKENDVLLIGSSVPHKFIGDTKSQTQEAISIYFNPEIFGKKLWELPELASAKRLIEKSKHGMKSSGARGTLQLFDIMKSSAKINLVLYLLMLLENLSIDRKPQIVSIKGYSKVPAKYQGQRMEEVIQFSEHNFRNKIELKEVANLCHLTPASFCREFKRYTRKSYFEYLNELRVNYTCNLLVKGNSIDFTWRNSGFHNQSNFNRQFKKVNGLTPTRYLNTILTN